MKVVVLGAGLMGKEAVRDLVKSDDVTKVYLADLHLRAAEDFAEQLMSDKLDLLQLDATNDLQLQEVMALGDVVINALFYTFNEKVARIAVEIGVHSIDLGGHIGGATDAVLGVAEKAEAKGVTIIPDLGVAPGMINILAGYGAVSSIKWIASSCTSAEYLLSRSLRLITMCVFTGRRFRSLYRPVPRHPQWTVAEVPSLSEVETIHFDEFGELEAFHTSGGTSTLTKTFSHVETFEYKTIRYKGHAEKFKLLVDLGLLSRDNEVTVGDKRVKVRDVMREQLSPQLRLGEKSDAVLIRVIVSGEAAECQQPMNTIW